MIDFTGHMTSLTDIDGSVFACEFDGEGNRLSQSLNDCLSKRFVYDGADVLLELNPTNGVAYAWVNGPGIDQPVERFLFIDGSPRARRVFHGDALGSVAALTDPSGLVTQSYAYAAFGALRSSSGPDLNRVTYTGREQLGDSQGWMYYRYRVYSPNTGRFGSRDMLGFIDGANIWTYVGNCPQKYNDPWGSQENDPSAYELFRLTWEGISQGQMRDVAQIARESNSAGYQPHANIFVTSALTIGQFWGTLIAEGLQMAFFELGANFGENQVQKWMTAPPSDDCEDRNLPQ